MNESIRFRPIRLDEIEQARQLIYGVARPQFHPEMTLEEVTAFWDEQGILNDLADIHKIYFENGGVFLVTEADGRMVGTGGFHRHAEGVCELRRFYLLSEYQRRGLGYAMFTELVRRAREMGYRKMVLLTDPRKQTRAVEFYRRAGFVEFPREGAAEEDLWMEMELI